MKKRVLAILAVLSVFVGMMPITSVSAASKSQAEAVAWANSKVGFAIDYDGAYGAQCVDLILSYYKNFFGVATVGGNGKDYATNRLPSGWTRVRYYSGFVAEPGDVAVWTATMKNQPNSGGALYGHVSIVTSANANSFTNVSQQGGSVKLVSNVKYGDANSDFWGVIRPVFSTTAKPKAPTSVSLSTSNIPNGGTFTATWSGASGTIEKYQVWLLNASNSAQIDYKETTGTSVPFTLPNSGTYKVRVKAWNGAAGASDDMSESGSVTAHNPSTVTFKDWDDTVISVQSVSYGGNANAPVAPSREGYTFQGWSGSHNNVTSDSVLTANYTKNRYTVTFVDKDGGTVSTSQVYHGDSAMAPTPPDAPVGKVFVGWNQNYDVITAPVTVKPVYVWENEDLPLVVSIGTASRNSAASGYNVVANITNYPQKSTKAKIVAVLKTAEGKMVASETEAINLTPDQNVSRDIFISYDGIATIAEVSIVDIIDNDRTGVPVSTSDSMTINLGLEWSNWQADEPEGDYDVENRTEYRYIDKEYTTSSNKNLTGWTYYNETKSWTGYGGWSNWSDSPYYENDYVKVKTQNVHIYTDYVYFHYCGSSLFAPWYQNATPTYHEHWTTTPLSWLRYSSTSGRDIFGYTSKCSTGKQEWYHKEEIPRYKTQWSYCERSLITTYYFYRWKSPSAWQTTAVNPTADRQVETRTVYRYKSPNIIKDFYNYKRYKYLSTANGNFYYSYSQTLPDSLGYTGEWEYARRETEFTPVGTIDGNIDIYNSTEDMWFRADVNTQGDISTFITQQTMEDTLGYERTIDGVTNSGVAGKKATLMIYKGINDDPTASQLQYVAQTTLGANGEYSFTFKTKDEPSIQSGDFTVLLGIEGATTPIYIETIPAPVPEYKVDFVDQDGTVIDSQMVLQGEAAVPPTNPELEGHTFIGWDTGIKNVREELTIQAVFAKNKYNVVFVDWDNRLIDILEYEYGATLTAPVATEKEGHQFTGWDILVDGTTTVTENMIITAQYEINEYTVVFYNWDGTEKNRQTVKHGEEAALPSSTTPKDGMIFDGWHDEYAASYVTQNMEIYPIFVYEGTVQTPTASLASGSYRGVQNVSLSTDTEDAKIYYMTLDIATQDEIGEIIPPFNYDEDGEITNATLYTAPISIDENKMLIFQGFAEGMNDSTPVVEVYEIDTQTLEQVAAPIANPPSGAITSGTSVTLSSATDGATIRYTTNGSEPTASSSVYTAPISLTESTTIKAKAFKSGMDDSITATFTYVVLGADAPTVTIGSVSGGAGDEVTVPVSFTNNPGIASFEVYLHFDKTKLEPISITQGAGITIGNITSNLQMGGDLSSLDLVTAVWYNASNMTSSGVYCTVKFKIKEDVEDGGIPLTLTVVNISNQASADVPTAVVPGAVNVVSFVYGDILVDGAINGKDIVRLAQHLALWPVNLTPNELKAADVFYDTVINGKDAVRLAQYLALWPVVLGDQ